MRVITGLIAVVLLLIALLGIGAGVWMMSLAFSVPATPEGRAIAVSTVLAIGAVPFLAGTVALAGVGAMFANEQVRVELEMARADRETLAAREAAQRRLERQRDPAFQAQVEAVKAEQRAAAKER